MSRSKTQQQFWWTRLDAFYGLHFYLSVVFVVVDEFGKTAPVTTTPPLPIRSKTSNQNYFEASLHRVSITRMNDSAVSVRGLVAVTTLYQYSQYSEKVPMYNCFHTFTHTEKVFIGTLFFTERWFGCQRSLKTSCQ